MMYALAFVDLGEYADGGIKLTEILVRLGLAMILGMAIGIERERTEHSAGMRTYAVVSMASALMMIVSIYGLPMVEGRPQDPGRIAAQVVSGIGFLGAGVIFMRRNVVHGLTTAASLWAVSGVGLATGGGLKVTAIAATFFLLLISGGLRPVKKHLFHQDSNEHRVRLHISDTSTIMRDIQKLSNAEPEFEITSFDFESSINKAKSVMELRIKVRDSDDAIIIVQKMEHLPGVERLGWHVDRLD